MHIQISDYVCVLPTSAIDTPLRVPLDSDYLSILESRILL